MPKSAHFSQFSLEKAPSLSRSTRPARNSLLANCVAARFHLSWSSVNENSIRNPSTMCRLSCASIGPAEPLPAVERHPGRRVADVDAVLQRVSEHYRSCADDAPRGDAHMLADNGIGSQDAVRPEGCVAEQDRRGREEAVVSHLGVVTDHAARPGHDVVADLA